MSKKNKTGAKIAAAVILFVLFGVFTLLVAKVDVQPIGPMGTSVGFATVNGALFDALGSSSVWNLITDVLVVASLMLGVAMGVIMLVQMFKRRGIFKADYRLIVLMFFYVSLLGPYLLLDKIGINYAPVLKDGELAPSYPSSHTFLLASILFAMPFVVPQVMHKRSFAPVCWVFAVMGSAVTCFGRLLSGEHWLTDVVGAMILTGAWVATYEAVCYIIGRRLHRRRRAARRR